MYTFEDIGRQALVEGIGVQRPSARKKLVGLRNGKKDSVAGSQSVRKNFMARSHPEGAFNT